MNRRFAILADAHLGMPQTQFPGQELSYAADLLRRAVDAVGRQGADEVIIAGDLVNMGTDEEYALAREILSPLRLPISTIPGNHELVKGNLQDFRTKCIGAKLGGSFGSDQHGLAFLNSGIEGLHPWHWHGQVDEEGLRTLDQATAEHANQPLLVFCHHPPEGTVCLPGYPMMGLLNTDAVMARLMRHPSPVVMFCGHTHVPDVYRRRNLTIIAAPPLCFWPHAFLIVDLRDGMMHITTHRLIDSPAQSPDQKIAQPGYVRERESWVPQITLRLGLPGETK